jgi:subtilisin family serine protease
MCLDRGWAGLLAMLAGLALWLALSGGVQAQAGEAPPPAAAPEYVPGEVIVGFRAAPTQLRAASVLAGLEAQAVEELDVCGRVGTTLLVRVAAGQEEPALELLRADPNVAYAERNGIVQAAQEEGDGVLPAELAGVEIPYAINDPLYAPDQWDMQRSNFSRAWQLLASQGKPVTPVRVAVVDSGVAFSHPDLAGRLLPGYNYVSPGQPPDDDYGHGTHIAGTIAALTNNGLGIVGGAVNVEILPLKVLGATGNGTFLNLASAICDAADQGARVINLSVQFAAYDSLIASAVDYAYEKGALLVAAAGNAPRSAYSCFLYYPAKYPNVIAVGALTVDNVRASYSCTGPELDIAAGGGDFVSLGGVPVVSTWPAAIAGGCSPGVIAANAAYCGKVGTSMAAPHVSAAAALLWSLRPTLTQQQVEAALKGTARPLGLPPYEVGAGLLDVAAALRQVLTSDLQLTPAAINRKVRMGAAPFATTILLTNPSLEPISVTGVLSSASSAANGWVRLSNVLSGSFSGELRYGQPGFLNVVISPTHLISGSYSATVFMTATRADGTKLQRALPINIQVGEFPYRAYLPIIRIPAQLAVTGAAPGSDVPPAAASAFAVAPAGQGEPSSGTTVAWETPISPTIYALGDSGSVTVELPFPFLFGPPSAARPVYTQATIHADGFISFGGFDPVADPGQNACLSLLSEPQQAIFGWWADLNPGVVGAEVSSFQPGSDRFVVQYTNVPSAVGVAPSYKVSLQIVLYASGNVRLNYGQVPQLGLIGFQATTPLATIGAQADQGLFFNQVSCHTANTKLGTLPVTGSSLLIRREDLY